MRIRISSGIYRILLFTVILFYSSQCMMFRVKHFRLDKNYHNKLSIYNSLKLNTQKSLQNIIEIVKSNKNYLGMHKSLTKIYRVPLSKFVKQYIPKGSVNNIVLRTANSSNRSFKYNSGHLRRNQSFNENNSERPKKQGGSPNELERSVFLKRKKREFSSVAETENGNANAGTITKDGRNAISKAQTNDGEALARSYAKGDGLSKASASAQEMGDATAIAKAKKSNSSSSALSQAGGDALAASESEGEGHAIALAQTRNMGGSTAVVQIEQGHGVATAIHMSDDPDHDEANYAKDTDDNDESEERPKMRMMGRTMGGEFEEESDEEEKEKIFNDKFLKTGHVYRPKKRKRKEGRKREKKFKFARFVT